MKTLRQDTRIEKYVSQLNGYLAAVSHLNDAVGYRHGFYADMIYLNDISPIDAAKRYLDTDSLDLREIDLKEERRIIEKYICHNFMLGDPLKNTANLSFVKEQLLWHIQEYISLAAANKKEETRWVQVLENEKGETTYLFVKISNYLIVMSFHFRIDDINA